MLLPSLGERKAQQNEYRLHDMCIFKVKSDCVLLTWHRVYFEGICTSVFPVKLHKTD